MVDSDRRLRIGGTSNKLADWHEVSLKWLKLAGTDEKDLSTQQSTTQTDARFSRADGDAGRAQRAQAAPGEGPKTARDINSVQAARLAGQAAPLGFKASDRLRRRVEFLRVQRAGSRCQTAHFAVYMMRTEETRSPRLGITVSRRIGGAVMRNRIKRRVRECFRTRLRPAIPDGSDLLVIARTGAARLETHAILEELTAATLNLTRRP